MRRNANQAGNTVTFSALFLPILIYMFSSKIRFYQYNSLCLHARSSDAPSIANQAAGPVTDVKS